MIEMQPHALELTHLFPGGQERVFHAWTKKAKLEKWFGPEGMKTVVHHLDLTVGGTYKFEMQNPDGSGVVEGEYKEITPFEKLVFTWRWSDWGQDVEDSLVTVQFIDKGEFTQVVLNHEKLVDAQAVAHHTHGWSSTFSSLSAFFESEEQA